MFPDIENAAVGQNKKRVMDALINTVSFDLIGDQVIKDILNNAENSKGLINYAITALAQRLRNYTIRDLKMIYKEMTFGKVKPKKVRGPPAYIDIAEICKMKYNVICLEKSKQLMIRTGNSYTFNLRPLVECVSKQITDLEINNYPGTRNSVFTVLEDTTLYPEDGFYFGTDYIPFRNGYLEVETGNLIKYNDESDIKFFYTIPHDYRTDIEYTCDKFKGKLTEWVINEESHMEIDDIFEMIGYTMTADTGFKAIFVNHGETNTGKSQLTNIIEHVIGESNVISTDLKRIQDRFESRFLQWKLMGTSADMSKAIIYDNGAIKNMSGGDKSTRGEIKGGDMYRYPPTVKFWCNVNLVPEVKDMKDLAFFTRIILIMFCQQYDVAEEGNAENYYEKITSQPFEIQGIIHEAIKGLKRLKKRKVFRPILRKDTQHRWLMLSNEVYKFKNTFCKTGKKLKIKRDELWSKFIDEYGSAVGKGNFYKTMEGFGHPVKETKELSSVSGKRRSEYYFLGLELKKKERESGSDVDRLFEAEES